MATVQHAFGSHDITNAYSCDRRTHLANDSSELVAEGAWKSSGTGKDDVAVFVRFDTMGIGTTDSGCTDVDDDFVF